MSKEKSSQHHDHPDHKPGYVDQHDHRDTSGWVCSCTQTNTMESHRESLTVWATEPDKARQSRYGE